MFQGNEWYSAFWEIFKEARNGSLKDDIFIFNFNSLDGFLFNFEKNGNVWERFPNLNAISFFGNIPRKLKLRTFPKLKTIIVENIVSTIIFIPETEYHFFLREQ